VLELGGQSHNVVIALYVASCVTAISCLVYLRLRNQIASRFAFIHKLGLILAVAALLFGTLMPFGNPDGFVIARFTFDPLLGFKQMLNLTSDVNDTEHTNAWAFANLFLLWPLASTMSYYLNRLRTISVLFLAIIVIELIQGFVWQLGRSFEIADIVSNMVGAIVLLWLTRNWQKS
jgi:hypothetical protein